MGFFEGGYRNLICFKVDTIHLDNTNQTEEKMDLLKITSKDSVKQMRKQTMLDGLE